MRNRPTLRRPLTIALGLALAAASPVVLAITNLEVNAGAQFSFSNPGARSLGLGGAFTGLADDATAAFANPAGLTILRTQELAFEARFTSFDTEFVDSGVVGFSQNQPIDDSRIMTSRNSESVFQPSYVSWVLPRERFTLAFYYQRLADFESSYRTQGLEIEFTVDGFRRDIFAANSRLDYNIQNVGAAFGYQLSDDFSVGASVAYSSFEINSSSERVSDPPFANLQRQSGDDNDVVFTLGTLWRISEQWNLGLAYRTGGEFSYAASNEALPSNQFFPNRIDKVADFDVPDVFSAGIAFRPSDAWLITLDVNRIYYSALTDSTTTLFLVPDDATAAIRVDDGTEVRLGVEYAFLNMDRPLFLRAGVWRDPDHRLSVPDSLAGDCGDGMEGDVDTFFECLDAVRFGSGDDEMHYSLGIGWAFEKFQIDAAADFSDLVDTYSISGVLRF